MIYRFLRIYSEMHKNVIEDLLLNMIVGNDVFIELSPQLESHSFNIDNIIANLNRWISCKI